MSSDHSQAVLRHVRFYKKESSAFGEREFWQCGLCEATGGDEPILGRTAREMAEKHFEKVRQHFRAVAFEPPPTAKEDDLYKWMQAEMAIYGQMSAADAAAIGAHMANDFYRYVVRARDELIEQLTVERDEWRAVAGTK